MDPEYSYDELQKMGAKPAPGTVPEYELHELMRMGAKPLTAAPPPPKPSSYDGEPDENLNFIQKGERGMERMGLIQPGQEMFSPKNFQAKKNAVKTFANDLSANYYPNLAAGVKTGSFSSPDYVQQRDAERKSLNEIPNDQALAGHLGAGAVGLALPTASSKYALGRLGIAAGTGAATGLLTNPGEAPGTQPGAQMDERVGQAKTGALLGGGPTALVEGLSLTAQKMAQVAPQVKEWAAQKALKQAGFMLKDLKALLHQGGTDKLAETGGTILEHGVVSPLSSLTNIADRSEALMEEHGAKTVAVAKALDTKLPQIGEHIPDALVTPNKIADRIEDFVGMNKLRNNPFLADFLPPVEKHLERLRAMGDAPIPFTQAEEWKRSLDDLVDWDKAGPIGKKFLKKMRGAVNSVIEDGVEKIAQQSNSPGFDQWKESKRVFGVMKDVNDAANSQLLMRAKNRSWSPSDYFATMAGLYTGDGLTSKLLWGAGAGSANHMARNYGNAVLASGAQGVANLSEKAPSFMKAFQNKGLLQQGLLGGRLSGGDR